MKWAGSGGGCGEVGGCVLPLCLFRSSTPLPVSLSPHSLFLAHYPLHQQTFSLDGSEKNCPLLLSPSAGARVLACPPDINQHTLGSVCAHTP